MNDCSIVYIERDVVCSIDNIFACTLKDYHVTISKYENS